MKTILKKALNRVNTEPVEVFKSFTYFVTLLIITIIDQWYTMYNENLYGTKYYCINHMRGRVTILISVLLGLIYLIFANKLNQETKKAKIELCKQAENSGPGVFMLFIMSMLNGIGKFYIVVSFISILYDMYEVVFFL